MSNKYWRSVTLKACEKARDFLSPGIAEETKFFEPEVYLGEHLGDYLSGKIVFFLWHNRSRKYHNKHLAFAFRCMKLTSIDNREVPDSVMDFLETISPAFSAEYIKGFAVRCDKFDRSIGNTNLSTPTSVADCFIRELSFRTWIGEICKAIALHCFNSVAPIKKRQRTMPQFDGPSDDPYPSQDSREDGGPFKQITLVGPDLLTAWNRFPFTRSLEQQCPRTPNWTPSEHGGMDVYHATSEHIGNAHFIEALSVRLFDGLRGSARRNHITQGTFPVVWTAFSPFRAFLWAVFGADVVRPLPGPQGQLKSTEAWEAEGKTYYGVALLQFSSTQPSPAGCTAYTIPAGKEDQWNNIASVGAPTNASPASLWGRFAAIHRQAQGTAWPELVHGLEPSLSRQNLNPFIKQFWRTVWFGEGINTLNSRHQQSLAICFHLRPDPPAPPMSTTPPTPPKSQERG